MDYDINNREPTITLIKSKIIDVQDKIIKYKIAETTRYDLTNGNVLISNDKQNHVRLIGNNGTVTCNKYCHGKSGQSWNNELPPSWRGAQCLSAGKNNQFGCNDINVYDNYPTDYVAPQTAPALDIANANADAATPNAAADAFISAAAATAAAQQAGDGSLQCLCQRNDTFPYSSAIAGDNMMPTNGLYNFNTGLSSVHQMSCGNDLTITSITTQCFKDLWNNAGCTIPSAIPTTGTYLIPGTAYSVDISNSIINLADSQLNLGSLKNIISQSTNTASAVCAANPSLSAMRGIIMQDLIEINALLIKIRPQQIDNNTYANESSAKLLNKINQLQTAFVNLQNDLNDPILLDGNYETSGIQASANFGSYVLFLFFSLFIIGSLIYIYINPEVGNLDIFILALSIIIFIYYIYEYIQKHKIVK